MSPMYDFPKFYQLPAANSIVDEVTISYALGIDSHDNELVTNPKVGDFAFIANNDKLNIFTEDLDLSANYTTRLYGYYRIGGDYFNSSVVFNIELLQPARDYVPPPPPLNCFRLVDYSMDISQGWRLSLGKVVSSWGDEMEVHFSTDAVRRFAEVEPDSNTLIIRKGDLTEGDVGRYKITVLSTFQNATMTEQCSGSFYLTIRNDNPFVPEPEPEVDLIDVADLVRNSGLEEGKQPDLPQITQVEEGLELAAAFSRDQPIPYIKDLTSTGLLCIEWDRPMIRPEDPQRINPARVAISRDNTTDAYLLERDDVVEEDERRMLYHRFYGMYDNLEDVPEWFLIIEALELKLRRGDPDTLYQSLNFTWEL